MFNDSTYAIFPKWSKMFIQKKLLKSPVSAAKIRKIIDSESVYPVLVCSCNFLPAVILKGSMKLFPHLRTVFHAVRFCKWN